eukprot:CAMPEP_0206240946 /NCGR_PEP_ID=MMETSP0047_2-20121206/16226_1 /ASSEMBLY_ACC=CAM_ASM_000192 /TAXON_ID=195065 /ORGANISM="Chroomonas mesostigmatica_cf, Strain CCMP1168" /LENGTH=655 /DNA_ID=CAMNT_0053665795 /DNA_START=101 /DNA_END=2064 /DNA_ORIENTATION=+
MPLVRLPLGALLALLVLGVASAIPAVVGPHMFGPIFITVPAPGEAQGLYMQNSTGRFLWAGPWHPAANIGSVVQDAEKQVVYACGISAVIGVHLHTEKEVMEAHWRDSAADGEGRCVGLAVDELTHDVYVAFAKGIFRLDCPAEPAEGADRVYCSFVTVVSEVSGELEGIIWNSPSISSSKGWITAVMRPPSTGPDTTLGYNLETGKIVEMAVRGVVQNGDHLTGVTVGRGAVYTTRSSGMVYKFVAKPGAAFVINSERLPAGCNSTGGVYIPNYAYRPLCFDSRTKLISYGPLMFSTPDETIPAIVIPAATPPKADLVPEGIAYDAAHDAWYLGSYQSADWDATVRTIVRLHEDGTTITVVGRVEDGWGLQGITPAHPWQGVLGLEMDYRRGALIAALASGDIGMAHTSDMTMINYIEIRDHAVMPTKMAPHGSRWLLNDVTVSAKGHIFATESRESQVFRVHPEKKEVLLFAAGGALVGGFANGVAVIATGASGREALLVGSDGKLVKIGGDISASGEPKCCNTACTTVALSCEEGVPEQLLVSVGGWGAWLTMGKIFKYIDGLAVSRDGSSVFVVDNGVKRIFKIASNDGWQTGYVANYLDVPKYCVTPSTGDFDKNGVFTYLCTNNWGKGPYTVYKALFPTSDRILPLPPP